MKKIFLLILSAVLSATPAIACGQNSDAFRKWHDSKYSMFIHFGLYSQHGGVWNGEPVRKGYSEQIQSFAGIFSDWYGQTAETFDPELFDADSIAALAKENGMKSIVFTSKHHDGFCMFETKTTDYNSVEMTPSGRDYVKELAEACERRGLNFGLYFSLIDWHYPHAYPISSHNADFITPQHHCLNINQVKELLTNYGPVSEMWFDMGSLTPEQSRELYDLVHTLQPDCLVSGRLGNDRYDFSVMADNVFPESSLQEPWQMPVSMFKETWSWRSWQERGKVEDKTAEKLRTLVNIVSRGGNFLLNIGPDKNGAVVPFERTVIENMGKWLKANGDAIYGTEASPFRTDFEWGTITRKGSRLYLILSGEMPENREITLPADGYRIVGCDVKEADCRMKNGILKITLSDKWFEEPENIKVIRIDFDKKFLPTAVDSVIPSGEWLTAANATHDYSYSCFDYYSSYRSIVANNWITDKDRITALEIRYTEEEFGKNVDIAIDGTRLQVTLGNEDNRESITLNPVFTAGPLYFKTLGSTLFDSAQDESDTESGTDEFSEISSPVTVKTSPFSNHVLTGTIHTDKDCGIILEAGAGNGIEVLLNGKTVMKHLNPYRCTYRAEKIYLPLAAGDNAVTVRGYNRFEKEVRLSLQAAGEQKLYRTTVMLPTVLSGQHHVIRLSNTNPETPHADAKLHNISIKPL